MGNANKVTIEQINAVIKQEHYFSAFDGATLAYWSDSDPNEPKSSEGAPEKNGPLGLLTFCVLVLENGFTVTGESACVSAANFNAEIGRKVARDNAVAKIWALEGYRLKSELHQAECPA